MRALIFAAGLGTRLRPLTDRMPKALVPVDGRPLLWHTIHRLVEVGAEELVVNVHHFGQQIIDYLAEHEWPVPIHVSDEREALLDTGGGLRRAIPLFAERDAPILIHNVDILSDAPLRAFYAESADVDVQLMVSRRDTQFIVLVIAQALVFNRIHLWGYATPMPYVFVLLILRHGTPRWLYVVVGFVTGLCIDAVSTTPGVAAGSLTLTGLCTPGVLQFFAPDDKLEEAFLPGARTMTWSGFLKFAATLSFVTVAGFHLLESFTFFRVVALLLNIGGSFVLTLAFVATFERVRVAFSSAETAAR